MRSVRNSIGVYLLNRYSLINERMPGIFDHIYVHIVFSIKDSASTIRREWRQPMQRTFAAILTIYGHQLVASAVQHDHVHILIRHHPRMLLPTVISKLKKESVQWLRQIDPELSSQFRWQKGYAVFSVSRNRIGSVRNYLAQQDQYHVLHTIKTEMERLLEVYLQDVSSEYELERAPSKVAEPQG